MRRYIGCSVEAPDARIVQQQRLRIPSIATMPDLNLSEPRAARGLRCGAAAAVALLLASCATTVPESRLPTPQEPGRGAPPAAGPAIPSTGAAAPGGTTVAPTPAPPAEPPARPSLGLFSHIKAPSDLDPTIALKATGVQIFRCEPDQDGYHWAFRLPEAELRDGRGQVVAHHGAGYSFEHVDGSRLVGTIVSHDSSSNGDSVPWLLLQTHSYGQGEFERVTYVQRVNTDGGMPPKQCSAEQSNQVLRVAFSADFIFYRPH